MKNEYIESKIKSKEFCIYGKRTTVCFITTVDDFELVGVSYCANPENFDKQIGEDAAYNNVILQLEPMMCYHENALNNIDDTIIINDQNAEIICRAVEAGYLKPININDKVTGIDYSNEGSKPIIINSNKDN